MRTVQRIDYLEFDGVTFEDSYHASSVSGRELLVSRDGEEVGTLSSDDEERLFQWLKGRRALRKAAYKS